MNNSHNETSGKDPNYWRSLRELSGQDPEAFEENANEFMKGVTDDFDISKLSQVSRRKFLALLSASVAFAASSCTNYHDKGEIIPYNKKPEEITPGVANLYASTCTGCRNACGTLVKTREGRPIKVDGNPDHPVNKGKICAIGQASVINLYDPNRLKTPVRLSDGAPSEIEWPIVDDGMIAELHKASSAGRQIAIISRIVTSPSEKMVLDNFIAKYPTAKVYSYEVFNNGVRNAAWRRSYSSGSFPLIQWDEARVIVSLEGDFLAGEGHTIENIRLFTKGRDGFMNTEFNRLYMVESTLTPTGIAADYRLRLKADRQLDFVLALMNEIAGRIGSPVKTPVTISLNDFVRKENLPAKTVEHMVTDLIDLSGKAVVFAGGKLPEDVHVAVNALNEMLGNTKLYRTGEAEVVQMPAAQKADWENLIGQMNNGSVPIVIHYNTNPVFDLPPDYGYESALKKVPFSIAMLLEENETSALCKYALPINHDLESWGDHNVRTGVYSLQQPVIYPLYSTRQKEAVLLTWASGDRKSYKDTVYHDFIMNNWEKGVYANANSPLDFRTFWFTALENGVFVSPKNASPEQNAHTAGAFQAASLSEIKPVPSGGSFTLYLKENYSIGDGRYANNGFLQELPHPVSKVVWDNYAAISPATAKELGVDYYDKIEVSLGSRKQEFPVFIQPGTADGAIVIELGYGRWKAGEVGSGVGINANMLMSKDARITPFIYNEVSVRKTSGTYKLVTTQEQHTIEDSRAKDAHLKRGIIKEGTVEEYQKNPAFLEKEEREKISMNKNPEYVGVKWAMGIDLNKCVGCNACITSCDVENNVPVVGKEQVNNGRIMHWFRVDRYYSGTPDEPVAFTQPMLCQHCDTAPCENVCPVAATTHSPDGLNQMVYNRCVGTRYCSNNCPYKVRRFNFFNFRDHFADGYYLQEPVEMLYNPEVTVRSRGVMEKCTFCIQRIMQARENAIEENRNLSGSDVVTACQQACPSSAIVFGDANDPDSIISKFRAHNLGYHVLVDLNTRPNITYLAKLRNIYPEV
ncbi:MAG TPA: TAT-variant-translocated molybdopterin oxidoreductase [Ignavibacteriales bacterium]|nr:TAT-variant-translocated molybdopterin oxidoreductase [Ignavibacteriales bacterium]